MSVGLYHRFGGFGSGHEVAVVRGDGTFETIPVAPGWYQLSVEKRSTTPNEDRGEFVEKTIQVQDRDLEGLSLVLGRGASISGRVVMGGGLTALAPGLRIAAARDYQQLSKPRVIYAKVNEDLSFQMAGLSDVFLLSVRAFRPPLVAASRIRLDGVEQPASAGVEFADGHHDVVIFIVPREPSEPTFDKTLPTAALVERFKTVKDFLSQFPIAQEIARRGDAKVLPALESLLTEEDRHLRGNAAFIFASLGDSRGFETILRILSDHSYRPLGQGIGGSFNPDAPAWWLRRQIRSDRYYAAHLLGDLKDPRAVPILIPLLKDADTKSIAPWALGQIGDKRAVGPLLEVLDDSSSSMRVLAIYALEDMHAKEAIPRLTSLLNDHEGSRVGNRVTVAEAAKAAISKLSQ